MSNVLRRRMFTLPKYEHQSTGIASGLEYRPGYRVGGRVSLHTGGDPGHAHSRPFAPGKTGVELVKREQYEEQEAKRALEAMQTKAVTNISNVTREGPISTDYNVGVPSLGKGQEFIDRQKQIEDILSQATEEIDYEKYAPTTGEIVGGGLTEAYDKLYGQPIEAGTLGKPSVVGTVVNEIAKQANAAVATQKELELLGETEKKSDKKAATEKALDLANNVYSTDLSALDASQKNEIAKSLGISAQKLDQYIAQGGWDIQEIISDRQSELGYATLDNQMQIAVKNAGVDLDIANIQAMAPTAEMKNFGSLLELKNADGTSMYEPSEAMSLAFKTQNSQLDFGAALMSALTSGQMVMDPGEQVLQAFRIMESMFGDSLNINIEDLEEKLNQQSTSDDSDDIDEFEKKFEDKKKKKDS